ncbi:MAG: TVP38/TMEM64 family protein [Actinomycetales bacterium]|nr:TVP38/TMEM64 family protein [Actinomycetales bacterium]
MLWLALNVRLPELETLQADIAGMGVWGLFAFVALYALVALTPIPVTIMAVTGGLVFGLPVGTVLSLVGVVIGCWGAYWLARGLGRETVLRLLGGHAQLVEERLEGGGFFAVCTLRLLPGVPYWPVNYGSGALGIRSHDFLVATALSSLPGQLSLVAIGAFIADPSVLHGAAVGISWVAVIALTILSFRRWRSTRLEQADG